MTARCGESTVVVDDVVGLRIGRDKPKHGVGTVECGADDLRVAVAADDNIGLRTNLLRQTGGVPGDDTQLGTAEEMAEQLRANSAGGCGDDDHGVCLGQARSVRRSPTNPGGAGLVSAG